MTVAAETRKAVREHPFVYDGLRAGIVNYTAAARFLDVGDTEAVGAALRRYAEDLSEYAPPDARGEGGVAHASPPVSAASSSVASSGSARARIVAIRSRSSSWRTARRSPA